MATRSTRSLGSEGGGASALALEIEARPAGLVAGLPPSSAPRPRPKAGFAIGPECRTLPAMSIKPDGFGVVSDLLLPGIIFSVTSARAGASMWLMYACRYSAL